MGCQQSNINASVVKKQKKKEEEYSSMDLDNSNLCSEEISFENSKDMEGLLHDLTIEEIDSHLLLRKATLEDLVLEDDTTTILGNLSELNDMSPAIAFGRRDQPSLGILPSNKSRFARRRDSEKVSIRRNGNSVGFAEF